MERIIEYENSFNKIPNYIIKNIIKYNIDYDVLDIKSKQIEILKNSSFKILKELSLVSNRFYDIVSKFISSQYYINHNIQFYGYSLIKSPPLLLNFKSFQMILNSYLMNDNDKDNDKDNVNKNDILSNLDTFIFDNKDINLIKVLSICRDGSGNEYLYINNNILFNQTYFQFPNLNTIYIDQYINCYRYQIILNKLLNSNSNLIDNSYNGIQYFTINKFNSNEIGFLETLISLHYNTLRYISICFISPNENIIISLLDILNKYYKQLNNIIFDFKVSPPNSNSNLNIKSNINYNHINFTQYIFNNIPNHYNYSALLKLISTSK